MKISKHTFITFHVLNVYTYAYVYIYALCIYACLYMYALYEMLQNKFNIIHKICNYIYILCKRK